MKISQLNGKIIQMFQPPIRYRFKTRTRDITDITNLLRILVPNLFPVLL
jgi:hypothetical protein